MAKYNGLMAKVSVLRTRVDSLIELGKQVEESWDEKALKSFQVKCKDLDHWTTEHENALYQILDLEKHPHSYQEKDIHTLMLEFDDRVTEVRVMKDNFEARSNPIVPSLQRTGQHEAPSMRLPTISVPTFAGQTSEWTSFYSLFKSLIIDNGTLTDVERLHYLRSNVKGEPFDLIKGLDTTGGNFAVAMNCLCERYENRRKIATAHADRIINFPSAQVPSARYLRSLITTYREHIEALRVLGVVSSDDDNTEGLFIFLILLRKLDSVTRGNFERALASNKEIPSPGQLISFLEKECAALEASGDTYKPMYKKREGWGPNTLASETVSKCVGCNQVTEHRLFQCPEFTRLRPDGRKELVIKKGLCFNCLQNHRASECSSNRRCRDCQGKHHTMIHVGYQGKKQKFTSKEASLSNGTGDSQEQVLDNGITLCTSNQTKARGSVVLSTIQVKIQNGAGQHEYIRGLLDTGSQASYITTYCARRLRLSYRKTSTQVRGLAQKGVEAKGEVLLHLMPSEGRHLSVPALMIDKITGTLPTVPLPPRLREHIGNLRMADPEFDLPGPIECLFGADVFARCLVEGRLELQEGGPVMLNTIFGWIMMGSVNTSESRSTALVVSYHAVTLPQLDETLQQFWEVEEPRRASQLPEDPDSPDLMVPRQNIASGATPIAAKENIMYQVTMKKHHYTYTQVLRIFVGTWNVNGQPPTIDMSYWLARDPKPPDIYAIGFQELDLSKEAFLFNGTPREVERRKVVMNAIHPKAHYRKVALVILVGMMLLVFVHERYAVYLRAVARETVGTGIIMVTLEDKYKIEPWTKYSSWMKVLRVMAYVLRFIHNALHPDVQRCGNLTNSEIRIAEICVLRMVQRETFGNELKALNNEELCSPRLQRLSPFLDKAGLIRVGGRLRDSNLPYCAKHPIILPRHHRVSELIVDYYHLMYLHAGPLLVHTNLVRKFWILAGRDLIRRQIHRCIVCFRQNARNQPPFMADLPAVRVRQARPFSAVSLDFAGPFLGRPHRRNHVRQKMYLCVFVCCSTKAVHLGAVSDLSTPAFLAAFQRFVSRRGLCLHVYSDRGSNLTGGESEMKRWMQHLHSPSQKTQLADFATQHAIIWHFQPPASPHFGGLHEAAVRQTKVHLKRVIGSQVLTYEEMSTLFCRVEAVLNSRPLCPKSSDPNELEALTPGHFLIGAPLVSPPDPRTDLHSSPQTRWRLIQSLSTHFWKRWHREYLHTLIQRSKWFANTEAVQAGALVLIQDEHLLPQQWKLARVIATKPGRDGIVRVVELKTTSGTLVRPAVKIFPLPMH